MHCWRAASRGARLCARIAEADWGKARRWLLSATPLLYVGVVTLSAIWLGGELQYLSVVRSHWAGAGTNYDAARLVLVDITSLLSLHPLRDGDLGDLYGVSLAAGLPAILGVVLAWRDQRARVFVGLALLALVLLTWGDPYRPLFAIPGFAEFAVVPHRPLLLVFSVAIRRSCFQPVQAAEAARVSSHALRGGHPAQARRILAQSSCS
jgi:hypothetical protein